MVKENRSQFIVLFTEEFELCLDEIQQFFAKKSGDGPVASFVLLNEGSTGTVRVKHMNRLFYILA
ncbi:hypothetical protein BKP45_21215 [Anaerobacillus alkalidiazotrophicus]|uniref:Uncharacterized protein n=1 Tax=Anaerobacillus alkalidiazotrophicus TaxID=472963 RepID=A0A1S2LYM0_9BACI|nr:hypothetical protein BKP45_21215 [Anaerobacillus alkalidiazotrophicus]